MELPSNAYDVWHDRAVFHFLTTIEQRAAYVRQVARAVKSGGYVLVSTFGSEGPTKCSGLEVVRYDAESLHAEFGVRFRLLSVVCPRTECAYLPFRFPAFTHCDYFRRVNGVSVSILAASACLKNTDS